MKKKKRTLPKPKLLNVSRYTFDVWMDSYPQSTEEEWLNTTQDTMMDFLYYQREVFLDAYKEYTEENYPKVRVIPLDNKYMQWLKKYHLQNTTENRLKYINLERTDEEVFALLKANRWDADYELMCIPVIVVNFTKKTIVTNFQLSAESKNALYQYLRDIYDNDAIFLSNYILKAEDYYVNSEIFLNMAKAYFDENINVQYKKWETQKYKNKNINVYQLVIPYVIRKEFKGARFHLASMEEDMYYMLSDVSFDKESFEILEKQNLFEFENSKLEKMIKKDFTGEGNDEVLISPYALSLENLSDELEMFQDMLMDGMARKNKGFFRV